jgi:hypothetical protein
VPWLLLLKRKEAPDAAPLFLTMVAKCGTQVAQKWSDRRTRRKPSGGVSQATPHKRAFEDGGKVAVFSCAETSFSATG